MPMRRRSGKRTPTRENGSQKTADAVTQTEFAGKPPGRDLPGGFFYVSMKNSIWGSTRCKIRRYRRKEMKMKEDGGVWRHELKYVCTEPQLAILEGRLGPLLTRDPHAGRDGSYTIRSVYFDDAWDSCFYENQDGTDPREKFRIRIYNGDTGHITLELKQKLRGMTRKISCPLTKENCERMLHGRPPTGQEDMRESGGNRADMPEVLRRFLIQQKERLLTAKVIVEYDRTPYVLRHGNVRITIDRNIASADSTSCFLGQGFLKRPVMPMGFQILEVKYDAFLPDYVRQVLQLDTLRRTSFSKYYECRKRGTNGISGYL